MRRLGLAAAMLGLALSPVAGFAQSAPAESGPPPLIVPLPARLTDDVSPLHFSIVHRGNRNVLVAFGGIESGDSGRFRDALDAAKPVDEIVLFSGGGVLDEGLEIGRIIHARKLSTHVLKGTECVSACNFMFMGGVVRYVDVGASFQVHMFANRQQIMFARDIVNPPRTFEALLRRYPVMDIDTLIAGIKEANSAFRFDGDKFVAARRSVMQQNHVDTSDPTLVNLEAVRTLISDFNRDHEDAPIRDADVIMTVVLSEDVKAVQKDSAETAAKIARFLTEMSLSLKFLTRFADIHNDQPTDLTRQELREFNVINTD